MAKHACISIGINRYQFFQPLSFASADAQALAEFFVSDVGWSPDRCLLMTDHSVPVDGISTTPNRQNIQEWLQKMCWERLQPGDFLWFFFSGYGINTGDAEYLVPLDGEPQHIQQTGISLANLYRQFSAPGIDVMVFLDVNRSQSVGSGQGFGEIVTQLSQEFNIPTFLSCQSNEFSHEAMGLKHGIFTAALLEALRFNLDLSIATLQEYLTSRVPELSEHHWRPLQHPLVVIPNDGTIYRPVFSATTQAAIGSLVGSPSHRPEPSRQRSSPAGSSAAASGLVPYETPRRSFKFRRQRSLKPVLIGIAGVTFIVGSLLVAIWPQAKNKPAAPVPVTKSISPNFTPPRQESRSESEFYQRVQQVIKPNDPNSYLQAIAMAERVPTSDPSYAQVQKSIADWSEEIYVIANAHAQKKEWQQAIQAAKLVPRDSALYPAARNAIRLWRLYLAGKPLPASLP